MTTHEVTNQPPLLVGYDVFSEDLALVEAVEREGAAWASDGLRALGVKAGSAETRESAELANTFTPVLRTHDRYGRRRDEVTYHPAYHELLSTAVDAGLHAATWAEERRGAHVARAAGGIVWSQTDQGQFCPLSMTYAVVPALRRSPALAAEWEPRITTRTHDPRFLPAEEKNGALFGMGMTEKQGGSDVRANTTYAEPTDEAGWYRLTGHKWFFSAPMGDAFLVLAQSPAGVSCFLLRRWLPDGTLNAIHLQRLKDKLGNRSNASSEVEFDGAMVQLVGEEGRGIRTIIDMVAHTRLDCVIGSAATMRAGVAEATHHAAHRRAFGAELVDQPLMRAVLADLAVESEAATALALRLARSYDAADDDVEARAFRRLATAIAKYWVCKRAPMHAAEALECLGGNGYVEESGMPRLYRDSPLNGIWEGSGNVICLDVLRGMAREPESLEAVMAELETARGADRRLDAHIDALGGHFVDVSTIEPRARRVVEDLAVALQGALLVRFGHPAVADAFCATRIAGDWGRAFGSLPAGLDVGAIVERARPKVA